MISRRTKTFVDCFERLPDHVKRSAQRCYLQWQANPKHPGLHFKQVGKNHRVYSVRIGIGWRAMGVVQNDSIIWFWVGSHAEYNHILKKYR